MWWVYLKKLAIYGSLIAVSITFTECILQVLCGFPYFRSSQKIGEDKFGLSPGEQEILDRLAQNYFECTKPTMIPPGHSCKTEEELEILLLKFVESKSVMTPRGYIFTPDMLLNKIQIDDYQWLTSQLCVSLKCDKGVCAYPTGKESYTHANITENELNCTTQVEEMHKFIVALSDSRWGGDSYQNAVNEALDIFMACAKDSTITTGDPCVPEKNFKKKYFFKFQERREEDRMRLYQMYTADFESKTKKICYPGAICNVTCICSNENDENCQNHTQKPVDCHAQAENVRKKYADYAEKEMGNTGGRSVLNNLPAILILFGTLVISTLIAVMIKYNQWFLIYMRSYGI